MKFEECEKIIEKFNDKTLYSTKMHIEKPFREGVKKLELKCPKDRKTICRIFSNPKIILYHSVNSLFQNRYYYEQLSEIEFTKLIMKIILDYVVLQS